MSDKLQAGARVHLTEVDLSTGALRGSVDLHAGGQKSLVRERKCSLTVTFERDIVWTDQIHSTRVELVVRCESVPTTAASREALGKPTTGGWGSIDADGIIVDVRSWQGAPVLAVQTADCSPVVFPTASGQIVAAVHAGCRGLLGGIPDKTVTRVRSLDGGPIDTLIGPAICGRCYGVSADMVDESEELMLGIRFVTSWDTLALSLPHAVASALGTRDMRVDIGERCTLKDADLFSYCADPFRGRQALTIAPA